MTALTTKLEIFSTVLNCIGLAFFSSVSLIISAANPLVGITSLMTTPLPFFAALMTRKETYICEVFWVTVVLNGFWIVLLSAAIIYSALGNVPDPISVTLFCFISTLPSALSIWLLLLRVRMEKAILKAWLKKPLVKWLALLLVALLSYSSYRVYKKPAMPSVPTGGETSAPHWRSFSREQTDHGWSKK